MYAIGLNMSHDIAKTWAITEDTLQFSEFLLYVHMFSFQPNQIDNLAKNILTSNNLKAYRIIVNGCAQIACIFVLGHYQFLGAHNCFLSFAHGKLLASQNGSCLRTKEYRSADKVLRQVTGIVHMSSH